MWRVRADRRCSLLIALILPVSAAFAAAIPQLAMDSINVRQEGVVSFSTLPLGPDSRSDFSTPRFLVGQTNDQAFRLYVDVDSIQQVRFNAFTFTAYLANAKEGGPGCYKFQITGNPTGSFRDAPVRVSFHVTAGTSSIEGAILIPVYNAAKADLLVVEKQRAPAYVSVSGKTPIQMNLGNVADSLPLSVTEIAVDDDCPACWARITSAVNQKAPLLINPGANANLPIEVFPNSIPALLQGALVIKPDMPHDTLAVTLTYHTVPAGADKRQTVLAPVRFGPGLFGLALALLGGIALGLLARYLLTGNVGKDAEHPAHALLSALVLGVIAEFVGIMLTAYGNSRLVLFGLDIDPRQLFPAFILAILVSGGAAVASWVKQLFGKA